MGGRGEPIGPAPEWEYLVAHHPADRYARTLGIRWRSRTLHLCARCSGQLLGLIVYLTAFVLLADRMPGWFATPAQYGVALLPLPAALDWLAQSIGRRESTNGLRLATGLLLGIAYADLVALFVTERWTLLLGGLALFAVYLGLIALVLRATGAWRRVIEEHVPAVAVEPGT